MKEMLFSICAAAVITAVYKALIPSDRFSAQVKLLVSCFFAVIVINALSGLNTAWDISDILEADLSYNDYTVQVFGLAEEKTADALRTAIYKKLAEEGAAPEKIYIDVNISDSGTISISEIKLVFGSVSDYDANAQRAVTITRRIAGYGTAVTAELAPQAKKEREDQ
ncbi:MAG: hypothetical protein II820_10570 [Ruminiclostridium sp.]|nr:hypothetical protein [Ruminiclostridium sp.]